MMIDFCVALKISFGEDPSRGHAMEIVWPEMDVPVGKTLAD